MLKEYEKLKLIDKNKKNHLIAEVNWEDNPTTNECKVIKFTCPDGKETFVDKDLLIQFLFILGTPQEQQNMLPVELTRKRWYETTLGIKALKDIKKGEMINVPVKIDLPTVKEEIIGELKRDVAKTGRIWKSKT